MNGEAVDDLALLKAGAAMLNPEGCGETPICPGEEPNGVEARASCHGAGLDDRMIVCRNGGGDVDRDSESLNRHRASSMLFSSDAPLRDVSLFRSSSSFSILSSSSKAASRSTGKQSS